MSDDYHRPTYTTRDPHSAFNATQVRLYGIPGLPRLKTRNDTAEINTAILNNQFALVGARIGIDPPASDDTMTVLKDIFDINATNSSYVFVNSIIANYMVMIGAIDVMPSVPKTEFTSGVIFGYAYEGHTYDLPKPKIMLIPAAPEPKIPDDDSGYDKKQLEGYAVWIVDKLNQCVEFEMNQGFVEQIVLEANLPGKRSPTMYASKMTMGHRGGKLND